MTIIKLARFIWCPAALILTLWVFLFENPVAHARGSYSRSETFGAVTFTHAELTEMLLTVQHFIDTANKAQTDWALQSVEISDGVATEKFNGRFSAEAFKPSLSTSYRVRFWYRRRDESSPIWDVTIDFDDWSRQVKIEGADRVQVDALFALVSQGIADHRVWFGGFGFRMLAMLLLWILSAILAEATFSKGSFVFPSARWRAVLVLAAPALSVLLLFQPFGPWLPGAAIYAVDTTFWGRHAALISFLAALLTVFAILQAVYLARRPRQATR